jgi:hypothetical protein
MSWQDSKLPNDLIDATEFTNMANTIEWVSGNYFSHSSNKNIHFPSSQLTNWLNNIYISTTASINKLNDVDTVSDTPARDEVLKWNGSNWVPAAYNTTFEFSIESFSDGESTTQLIGTGVWKSDSTITFSATYNNGPPDGAWVQMSNNGGAYSKVGSMTASTYTTGTNDEGDINYPASKDQYLRFRLSANCATDTDSTTETSIYFRNYIYYGKLNKGSSFSEADVESLAGSTISNDTTQSWGSINVGAGEYLVFAYPASYTTLDYGNDYEDDGDCDFDFNGFVVAMNAPETVSLTNSAGFTENYKVFASTIANLGNYTFRTDVSLRNYLYYGKTTTTSSFSEADVEGLSTSTITNDNTQTWSAITTGAGEYMLFAFPVRLGTVTFWVGGFEGGFESPETVSVTNANGFSEDYYVWRSENSNLGSTVVTTT